ncbi:hypothetical protein JNX00_11330 [Hydrogenophaga sp. YM1]|uniref:hypothetical protein n=1 Tax=Hydrogenophaga sp. YM1 TaxID=2806262 RepID=UPI0019566C45|nr:hypothetical protein [Hydrogenophaga sp. YM1]QRR32286.1 hypothetical protein JNX00_11330 [Hydrogenophaga sp. YM1]
MKIKQARQQAAQQLPATFEGESLTLIYDRHKGSRQDAKEQALRGAAIVIESLYGVLYNSHANKAIVMGFNSEGRLRVAVKGFFHSNPFSYKQEQKRGAGQLNIACRILKKWHGDSRVREAASNLQAYIHLKRTTNIPALRAAMNELNEALKASAHAREGGVRPCNEVEMTAD